MTVSICDCLRKNQSRVSKQRSNDSMRNFTALVLYNALSNKCCVSIQFHILSRRTLQSLSDSSILKNLDLEIILIFAPLIFPGYVKQCFKTKLTVWIIYLFIIFNDITYRFEMDSDPFTIQLNRYSHEWWTIVTLPIHWFIHTSMRAGNFNFIAPVVDKWSNENKNC